MSSAQHVALEKIVGQSPWTQEVRAQIQKLGKHRLGVLITGPSGTGKELIARAVHAFSARYDKPFIPVNCAAIPPALMSSQLFGHVKGAFTGAQYASLGCFRAASGGTIFLDEIGELDLESQAKLLRVLQESVVTPVGDTVEIPIDVRTVAATNRDLASDVRSGRFRLDLYYRLNVMSIRTRGLAERREDVLPLANHFLARAAIESGTEFKELSEAAIKLLEGHDWPGNVRELENYIERAVVLSDDPLIGPESFSDIYFDTPSLVPFPETWDAPNFAPPRDEQGQPLKGTNVNVGIPAQAEMDAGIAALALEDWPTLDDVEAQHIGKTLKATFFNQSAAARLLGIDRKSLARKIKKYGIDARPPSGKPHTPM